jgi:hemerythrin-like domain-containing protein
LITTDPFEVLEQEHRLISRVLDALARAVERDMPLDFYARALEFLEVYATQFHHAKEEDILYRYLIEHGMPRDYGPLGVVLEEHDYGDAHLAAMRERLEARDVPALREEVRAYVGLLRAHVQTEDDLLLPMGRATLTSEEVARLAEAFAAVPAPPPSARAWEEWAEHLCAEVEVPA